MTVPTVALVGPDGAGKTTIARMLVTRFPMPMKRIYMGVSVQSSNVVLPTTRLIQTLKRRAYRKRMQRANAPPLPEMTATDHLETRPVRRGGVGSMLRLAHRVAEEWYRQLVAWRYQRRGYVVLYDRHFLFEYNPASVEKRTYVKFSLNYRLHLWLLERFYPRPDLVIFLDAPPEVLRSRKPERALEDIQRYREDLIRQGRDVKNFVTIDVTQPVDKVLVDIINLIVQFRASNSI